MFFKPLTSSNEILPILQESSSANLSLAALADFSLSFLAFSSFFTMKMKNEN